jgi:3-hydroxybutyryl-CoA dehydrogenase
MGIGVSHVFAAAGLEVVLVDLADHILDRARVQIRRNVAMTALIRPDAPRTDPDEVTGRILFTSDAKNLRDVDYLVENVTEKWDVKSRLYAALDEICPPDVPFGVNTSAIPIGRISSVSGRAPLVVGTHFMNPAPLKPTVEVIRGRHTSDATIERTRNLLTGVGKKSIVVNDSPGFVTNRVAMLMVNEAAHLLHEGVSSARDIDRLFTECFGHAMGPLETADLIGLDTVLLSLEVLHDSFNDPKYLPCPLLRQLVDAGLHGRKTGRGFHFYEPGAAPPPREKK